MRSSGLFSVIRPLLEGMAACQGSLFRRYHETCGPRPSAPRQSVLRAMYIGPPLWRGNP
jgi:hypothetical protein